MSSIKFLFSVRRKNANSDLMKDFALNAIFHGNKGDILIIQKAVGLGGEVL